MNIRFKPTIVLLSASFILLSSCFSTSKLSQEEPAPSIMTSMDSISYAVGLWIATGPLDVPDKDSINLRLINKALEDAFSGNDSLFSKEKVQQILMMFSKDQQEKQQLIDNKAGESIKEEGTLFLSKNKEKEGVIETESGLQYQVIAEGTGKSPKNTDIVKVHYKGTLINGDVFDSSYDRGEPVEFPLNRVIPGWTEGLQLMKEGGKYKFFIPSELGYGDKSAGDKIKPFSTLIFEVELLEVKEEESFLNQPGSIVE